MLLRLGIVEKVCCYTQGIFNCVTVDVNRSKCHQFSGYKSDTPFDNDDNNGHTKVLWTQLLGVNERTDDKNRGFRQARV